jgi:hypothetical protein
LAVIKERDRLIKWISAKIDESGVRIVLGCELWELGEDRSRPVIAIGVILQLVPASSQRAFKCVKGGAFCVTNAKSLKVKFMKRECTFTWKCWNLFDSAAKVRQEVKEIMSIPRA